MLKCTTQHNLLRDDHLAWKMEAKPFAKLTNPKRYNEAFLGVLVIPRAPDPWVELSDNGLRTASRLYWRHAANLGTIAEGQESKTVHLPRSNLFDAAGLGEGGTW